MAASRKHQTLADYVTIALSPALIIALITSLIFFLIEILYGGEFSSRLRWTMFWFICGIVLVARIAMHPAIYQRAKLYGLLLVFAAWLGLQRFLSVEAIFDPDSAAPLLPFDWAVHLALLALVWWCAYRLTWDCTYIDDQIDASGKGVLEAAGLEPTPPAAAPPPEPHRRTAGKEQASLSGWLDRYRAYREEQRRKPHTPGVWVVYFSLAALPLFGLGQALVPADAVERRRYTFQLLAIYVASGLGLLLTTAFLGLRRYLRQRKLHMPAAMTGLWLGVGGLLIAVILVVATILPRPNAEYSLLQMVKAGSRERSASPYALRDDGKGKGQGRASSDPQTRDDQAQAGSGNQRGDEGRAVQGKSPANSSRGQAQQGDNSRSGKKGSDGRRSKDRADDSSRSHNPNRDEQQSGEQGPEEKAQKREREDEDEPRSGGSDRPRQSSGSSRQRSSSDGSGPFTSGLATVLKWVVFAVLALIVLYCLCRFGLSWLANFTSWARNLLKTLDAFWAGLIGKRAGQAGEPAGTEELADKPVARPFAAYSNPFHDGRASRMSARQLLRYSFEALQAFARERGQPRRDHETPSEFVQRLGNEWPTLETEARQLVQLYVRAAYAAGSLPASTPAVVEQFWARLDAVAV